MNENKKRNLTLVSLILEFVIIVVLAISLFLNKTKEPDIKYVYKEKINFLCTKVEDGQDSIYTHEAYITTNIKGKITEITNIRKYKYDEQTRYNNQKENYTVDDTNIKLEFIDKSQEMIITEPPQKENFNINSYYSYEEKMTENNYKCELIEKK